MGEGEGAVCKKYKRAGLHAYLVVVFFCFFFFFFLDIMRIIIAIKLHYRVTSKPLFFPSAKDMDP